MTGELPPTPADWPLAMWDMLRERAAMHEADGLAPGMARIRAEQECRAWRRAVPDEREWLESLPPVPAPATTKARRRP